MKKRIVVWLISLPRSGSSVTAYAAAHPFGHTVADEFLGVWDRTGEPYNLPSMQADLVRIYQEDEFQLTERVVKLSHEVLDAIDAPTGVILVKHPHGLFPPKPTFQQAFPGHRVAFMLRHPLRRLNSLYKRGWLDSIPEGKDILRYKALIERYHDRPSAVVFFDDLRTEPRKFFEKLYKAWQLPFDEKHLDQAVEYASSHYHSNSAEIDANADPSQLLSQEEFVVPDDVVKRYMDDPIVEAFLREKGWLNADEPVV